MCVREKEKEREGYQTERYTNCVEDIIPGYVDTTGFFFFSVKRVLFVKSSYPHSLVSLKSLGLKVKMETNY